MPVTSQNSCAPSKYLIVYISNPYKPCKIKTNVLCIYPIYPRLLIIEMSTTSVSGFGVDGRLRQLRLVMGLTRGEDFVDLHPLLPEEALVDLHRGLCWMDSRMAVCSATSSAWVISNSVMVSSMAKPAAGSASHSCSTGSSSSRSAPSWVGGTTPPSPVVAPPPDLPLHGPGVLLRYRDLEEMVVIPSLSNRIAKGVTYLK